MYYHSNLGDLWINVIVFLSLSWPMIRLQEWDKTSNPGDSQGNRRGKSNKDGVRLNRRLRVQSDTV